jgi:hypothetical protein
MDETNIPDVVLAGVAETWRGPPNSQPQTSTLSRELPTCLNTQLRLQQRHSKYIRLASIPVKGKPIPCHSRPLAAVNWGNSRQPPLRFGTFPSSARLHLQRVRIKVRPPIWSISLR